jgi:hypothetical protein
MADLGQIQNDQSIAQATQPLNVLRSSQADFKPPVSIQKVDTALDGIQSVDGLTYPTDVPKYFMMFNVSGYTRQSLMTVGTLTPEATVVLPLPEQLVDTNHVEFGEAALGSFGQGINAVEATSGPKMKNVISSVQQITSARDISSAWGIAKNAFNNSGLSVGDAVTGVVTAATSGAFSSLPGEAQAAFGVLGFAPNEFFTVLLKGPVYKRHHFSWRFSPRNEQESRNLRKIIQSFNNWKAPGLALGGALFTFPKLFQIGFSPNSSYLYKFKPAVLEDFVIDYAASGLPTFFRADNDGLNAPESIAFSMSFLEIEYWIEGDFMNVDSDGSPDNDPTHVDGPNRGH